MPELDEIDSEHKGLIKTSSATQRAYHDIRKLIINCDITPGERLKVESLKVRLDTGTAPIREALSLLTSDQLVERIDQRGFRSAPANKAHFEEILSLRCQLDELALRNSILRGGTQWKENLVLSHYRLSQLDRIDGELWEMRHREFHRALLQACDSPILLRFSDQLYDLNIRYRYLAGKSLRYGKRDIAGEHQAILNASLAGDVETACSELDNHYSKTGEFLADQFDYGLVKLNMMHRTL